MEKKLQIYLVDDSQEMIQKMKNNLKNSHLFEVIGSEMCIRDRKCPIHQRRGTGTARYLGAMVHRR